MTETVADHGAKEKAIATVLEGVITGAAVLLAFGAFDDITTDNATSFATEYLCLSLCLVWMAVLVVRLASRGRLALAALNALLVLTIVWGQQKIGPGTVASWQLEYAAATAAIFGLLLVAGWLIVSGIRSLRRRPTAA